MSVYRLAWILVVLAIALPLAGIYLISQAGYDLAYSAYVTGNAVLGATPIQLASTLTANNSAVDASAVLPWLFIARIAGAVALPGALLLLATSYFAKRERDWRRFRQETADLLRQADPKLAAAYERIPWLRG
jgi:hypothetical protein